MKCKNCNKHSQVYLNGELVHFCDITGLGRDGDAERECKYYEVMTNADKIRNMTNDELEELLEDFMECGIQSEKEHVGMCSWCHNKKCKNVKKWLEKKVEE